MNNNTDSISGFFTGLLTGAALTLTGGYFFGPLLLHKVLREHDTERRGDVDPTRHLDRAQEALHADSAGADCPHEDYIDE